ncbi:DUF4258 domain-containing protein, partial [Lamprobacter modestohalophilus]
LLAMSECFESHRFSRKVWLTNHAIESMAKRSITLLEVKQLIEEGEYRAKSQADGWIFRHFESRSDNLVCAAVVTEQAIIVKTIMVDWTLRESR